MSPTRTYSHSIQKWAIKVLGLVGMVLIYSPGSSVVHSLSERELQQQALLVSGGGGSVEAHAESSCAATDSMTTTRRRDSLFSLDTILADLERKYSHQPTFLQAVQEMALSIADLLLDNDNDSTLLYRKAFAVLTEPERTIAFRVSWMDDQGQLQYNRAWRVEFNRYESLWNCRRLIFTVSLILVSLAYHTTAHWVHTREACAFIRRSTRVFSSFWALSKSSRMP
jgi:hypothetical protein